MGAKMKLEDAVALLDLPSQDHVGATLLSYGITDGHPESSGSCPIAKFLNVRTQRYISVGTTDAFLGGRIVPLPPAAREFIAWFDRMADEES